MMIAAMAAAVSPTSTLRLVSGPRAKLSGTLALAGVGPAVEFGAAGRCVGTCAAGPLEVAGWAKPDGEVTTAATGA